MNLIEVRDLDKEQSMLDEHDDKMSDITTRIRHLLAIAPYYTGVLIPGSHPVHGFHWANFKDSQKWFLAC